MRNRTDQVRFFEIWTLIALATLALALAAGHAGALLTSESSAAGMEVIQTEELLKAMQLNSAKPIVLYVGPRFLFAQAHIRGAESVGAALEPESLQKLRKRVAGLPKTSPIVIYCGCCPWEHCPNIRPAYKELQKMGFTKVKALYLAASFGTDWADKGYPVEKGE